MRTQRIYGHLLPLLGGLRWITRRFKEDDESLSGSRVSASRELLLINCDDRRVEFEVLRLGGCKRHTVVNPISNEEIDRTSDC